MPETEEAGDESSMRIKVLSFGRAYIRNTDYLKMLELAINKSIDQTLVSNIKPLQAIWEQDGKRETSAYRIHGACLRDRIAQQNW